MVYEDNSFYNDDRSIYSAEEYERLTGGKYGKEIFVPFNNNIFVDEEELKSKIPNGEFFEYIVKSIRRTVKCEDVLVRQILYTGLSSYIEDDPINLGIIAPTSEGKTYPVEEAIKFFPKEDVIKVGSMSAKVLIRQRGILVDKNLNPIEDKLRELRKQKNLTKDQEDKEKIIEEIEKLYKDAKTLIDLTGKILVFLEPPHREVWNILKPILSHDSKEIEFPFVNQTDREGHQTKNVVVRGWPSCIFCSARDESKWEMWSEIKSRFLISSPNMIPQKYKESTKLISQKTGKPNLIQQQIIISDDEIYNARQCILLLKQKINELKLKNDNGKISLWIPYAELLEKELPSNKGTDVRLQKRIFSLLRIVPIIKSNHKKLLKLGNETSVIADLNDLKEVLSITQNFDGIPKFKIEYFNNIFYPCYKSKIKPDSNQNGTKQEEMIALTTKQLCDYFKEKTGKSISTDNMKSTYLNELLNNGLIDHDISKIDNRQYIYYPLVEPTTTLLESSSSIASTNDNTTTTISADIRKDESISSISITNSIDNFSQFRSKIYEKIITNITETWLFYEIMALLRYRLDMTSIRGPLADYLNNHEEFQLWDNDGNNDNNCCDSTSTLESRAKNQVIEETTKEIEQQLSKTVDQSCCCCCRYDVGQRNDSSNNSSRLTIRQFIKNYTDNSSTTIDIKRSSNIAPFGKISPLISNLDKIDIEDITNGTI